jgi:conjugative relaxase-like TrwC/TraI family protein
MSEAHPPGMLSLSRMGVGAEAYYLREVADGLEGYYSGAGESPGVWIGSACRDLGLVGEVAPEDLSAVLAGRSPRDGSELGSNRVAPERRVAGFDLTFSAPKSVSVLYGLGSDTVSREVRDAHHEAVVDALGYLETHAALARRGHGGLNVLSTSGLVAAGYTHRTSRNGDPQLHTHVLVANVVHGTDGKWSALSSSPLHHQVRTAGFVYQAALRTALVERLGVSFGPVVKGAAEIEGIPKGVLSEFSSRRQEILSRLEDLGGSSRRTREIATLETRHAKDPGLEGPGLRERWLAQGMEMGFGREEAEAVLGLPGRSELTLEDAEQVRKELLGRDGLTAERSAFERRDVVRAVAESLPDGARLHEIEGFAEWFVGDEEVVALERASRAGERLLTTREMLRLEASVLSASREMAGRGARVPEQVLESVLSERPELSEEQAEMVRRLTTSGDGLQVVIGKAGTGKTYALDAARAAFQRGGYRVLGTALAARAAAELEAGAGIPSCTLARFLEPDNLTAIGLRDVIVLDEAGMVGTRQLHELVRAAKRSMATVVLVGDHRQLPEIEAGGAFLGLGREVGAIELTENRRQVERWEREALDELRSGTVGKAVVAFDAHERIHLGQSAPSTREEMVRDFAKAYLEGASARMYALTRHDVDELNLLAREELRRAGRLGNDVMSVAGRSFALADDVLFCRNDRRLAVMNGTRGTVIGLGDGGGLRVMTDEGERLATRDYLEAGHVAHGYASTVHKAQGATVDRAFVLGSDAIYREAGYVAMSRARERTDLYVVTSAFDLSPLGTYSEQALCDALASSRAKELAVESLRSGVPEGPGLELGGSPTPAGWEAVPLTREREREDEPALIVTPRRQARDRDDPFGQLVGTSARVAKVRELERAVDRLERPGRPNRARSETERAAEIAEVLLGEALGHGRHDHMAAVIGERPEIPKARSLWSRLAGRLQAHLQHSNELEQTRELARDDPFAWMKGLGILDKERDRGLGLGR